MGPPMPSDEDIETFQNFTSCGDKYFATRFLQGANNDLQQAMNNYMDNPGLYDEVSGGLYSDDGYKLVLTRYRARMMNPPSNMTDTEATPT